MFVEIMGFTDYSDELEECRQVRHGIPLLPTWREKMRLQLSKRFKICVLNIVLDSIQGRNGEIPRFNLFLDSQNDRSRIERSRWTIKPHVRSSIRRQISDFGYEFKELRDLDSDQLRIILTCCEEEHRVIAVDNFFRNDRDFVLKKFTKHEVWKIEGGAGIFERIVCFFEDELTKEDAYRSGLAEEIKKDCFQLVKQYDEFDYLQYENFQFDFESRQRLNEQYEGSLFYYFR